jgi:hypothetical protein
VEWLIYILVAAAACYKIGRAIQLDSVFACPRVLFLQVADKTPPTRWLAKMLMCPWCVTFWIALAIVGGTYQWTDYDVPMPVFTVLAVQTGSLYIWSLLDNTDNPDEAREKRQEAMTCNWRWVVDEDLT